MCHGVLVARPALLHSTELTPLLPGSTAQHPTLAHSSWLALLCSDTAVQVIWCVVTGCAVTSVSRASHSHTPVPCPPSAVPDGMARCNSRGRLPPICRAPLCRQGCPCPPKIYNLYNRRFRLLKALCLSLTCSTCIVSVGFLIC